MEVKRSGLQRLSEHVGMVVLSSNMLDNYLTISHQLADLEVAPLDVASPLARLLVLRKLNRPLVIHVKHRRFEIMA